MSTLGEELRAASAELEESGVASPDNDARLLAAHLLGCAPLDLALRRREELDTGVTVEFRAAVARRARREPLQHILGRAPMGPLDLHVGPGVFIPRPETEVLADWAVRQLRGQTGPVVVDLCTGSGALAAYIGHARVDAHLTAVELSTEAAAWARRNFAEFAPQVNLVQGDVTDAGLLPELHGTVDLVVTNPPYVPESPDLEPEVYHDPHEAVFSGAGGMDVITGMLPLIHALLKPGGLVGMEHDDSTSAAVQQVFHGHGGFTGVSVLHDLTGRARFVTAGKL